MFFITDIKEITIKGVNSPLINSMKSMFRECEYLSSVNFLNINFSKVETMERMFSECENLLSINLSNLDMSNVKSTSEMFSICPSLISVDFSNTKFDKLQTMAYMFANCLKLSSLALFDGNLPELSTMNGAFYACISLTSINLSGFNATNLDSIMGIFIYCFKLQKINFDNFNTGKVKQLDYSFYNCTSLTSIDLTPLNFQKIETARYMFSLCNSLKSVKVNFTNSPIEDIYKMFFNCESLKTVNFINLNMTKLNNISDAFYGCYNLEYINMPNSNWNKNILIDNPYNNISDNAVICTEKNENNMLYYYINDTKCLTWDCSDNWKRNRMKIISELNICIKSCNMTNSSYYNYSYLYEYEGICFNKCPNDTYIHKDDDYFCTSIYKESKDYYLEKGGCPMEVFLDNKCIPNKTNNDSNKDVISFIIEEIENGSFEQIFEESIKEDKIFIANYSNITYQISTLKNQNKTNLSVINIEEDELKSKLGLNQDETLIILKVEHNITGIRIPIIEYTLFTSNGTRLDLSSSPDLLITYSIPVDIDEKKEYIHNPKSEFYLEKCSSFTSEDNTDITIYDRKNDYNKNSYSLCENGCEYKGYNSENKRVDCECSIKTEIRSLLNITIDKGQLLHNFKNFKEISNIFVLKCYKLLFNKNGIIKNIGSYLILIIIIITILDLIAFFRGGFKLFEIRVYGIIYKGFMNIQSDINIKTNNNKIEIDTNYSNTKGSPSLSRNFLFFKGNIINKNEKEIKIKKTNKEDNQNFENDYEINYLEYKEALIYDKRSFFEYYLSLIRINHLIVSSFYTNNDFNSKFIKICLFIFSFSVLYAVNALFFNDSTMHKIYEDKGAYNLTYQLPIIIYSTLISVVIKMILKKIISSEEKILEIKKIKETNKALKEAKNFFKVLKKKFIIFFIINILFLLLFWYYLSCFGVVYKNTQITLLKDTIISFITSQITPFFIELIPCSLRRIALKAKKKNRNCLDKVSVLAQLL